MLRRITWLFLLMVCMSGHSTFAQSVRPHYIPDGYETTSSGEDQADQYYRLLNFACLANAANSELINAQTITRQVTYKGNVVNYIFNVYHKDSQGRIYYYDACGQTQLDKQKLEQSILYFIQNSEDAARYAAEFHKGKQKRFLVQISRETGMSEDEIIRMMKKTDPVSGNSNITFADTFDFPKDQDWMDFLTQVKEIHLAHTPENYLGLTYSDTGACFISPALMIADYITGKPVRLGHELMHANREFQKMPYLNFFDFETMASVPSLLMPDDGFFFITHSYARRLRPFIRAYFNLDLDRAENEIFPVTLAGSRVMNHEKFRIWAIEIEKVKIELLNFFRRIDDELTVHRWYWFALHEKLGDNLAIFKIMLALMYEPTGLGGQNSTAKWILKHKGEITDDAEAAFKASGTDDSTTTDQKSSISPMLRDYFESKKINPKLFEQRAREQNIPIKIENIQKLITLALELKNN